MNAVSWTETTHATEAEPGDKSAATLCGASVYGGDLNRKLPIGWWTETPTYSDGTPYELGYDPVELVSCKRCKGRLA